MFFFSMLAHAQVYISGKANGHRVDFLIISEDSVIFETYTMRYKLPIPLSRRINKYHIIQKSDGIIKTDKFNILVKSNDVLEIDKITYFRDLVIEKPGDFIYINNLFGSICNHSRLKCCRSYYTKQKINNPYDFTNNDQNHLGKKGNSTLENIGYGLGALANLSDGFALLRGGGQNIKVNSAKTSKEDWWGHSSITDQNGNSLVSVGPPFNDTVRKSNSLSETWRNSIKNANLKWNTYLGKEGTWSVELNNISTTAISKYTSGITRWDLLLNSCVGHTSRALWSAGVPNIYFFHPHFLNAQLLIRQLGIYSSPYIYQNFYKY